MHPARHVKRPQSAEHQAEQHGQQGLQQEQQQVLTVPHQVNAGDLHPAPQHGLIHRPRQNEPCQILLKTGPGGAHGPAPAGQQLAARQIDAGPRHILVGGDGLQRLAGRLFVVEHHGRFAGVADGSRHQFQVVIRIEPQCQQGDAGQQHTGHADRRQGRHQVGASQTLSQGEALVGGAEQADHEPPSSALASLSTAGCTRTPLLARASRLTRKRIRSLPICRQKTESATHSVLCSLMLRMG